MTIRLVKLGRFVWVSITPLLTCPHMTETVPSWILHVCKIVLDNLDFIVAFSMQMIAANARSMSIHLAINEKGEVFDGRQNRLDLEYSSKPLSKVRGDFTGDQVIEGIISIISGTCREENAVSANRHNCSW